MRFDEYQERKRVLEEQLQADLELIRSAHRTKLQALELLWLSSAEREAAGSTPPEPQEPPRRESQGQNETQAPLETQRTRRTGSAEDEVEDVLPVLPDLFDKDDVIRALGWEPHRATLQRALNRLRIGKQITIEIRGEGRRPTRYRKVGGV
jgi:hypothetical protein